ncbi:MAG: HEPN domain-containing protein [Chromatiales bacterium]|nr:HEPN domain-containing protein [Chromatiales bacterium]
MSTLYFPLIITCNRKTIKITDSISLSRIDIKKNRELIGVEEIIVNESGHVISWSGYSDSSPWYFWALHLRDNIGANLHLRQMNFILEVQKREEALLVGIAMKLLCGTKSGPYIGFSDIRLSSFSVHSLIHRPYWGEGYLYLGKKEIKQLKSLVRQLEGLQADKKLNTIIKKFWYSESYSGQATSIRFLEMSVILEMLFLPKAVSELSYRFQLRMAKWFNRHYRKNLKEVADDAKKIYRTRSKIAHSGTAKISRDELNNVRDYVRFAVRKYLTDPSIFKDDYLEELCLMG